MTVERQDFGLYSGSTFQIDITVTKADGTPFDLTLSTAKWVLYSADVILITKTTDPGGGITFPAPVSGLMRIVGEAADTEGLVSGIYGHEARVIDTFGNELPVTTGLVTIEESKSD